MPCYSDRVNTQHIFRLELGQLWCCPNIAEAVYQYAAVLLLSPSIKEQFLVDQYE